MKSKIEILIDSFISEQTQATKEIDERFKNKRGKQKFITTIAVFNLKHGLKYKCPHGGGGYAVLKYPTKINPSVQIIPISFYEDELGWRVKEKEIILIFLEDILSIEFRSSKTIFISQLPKAIKI